MDTLTHYALSLFAGLSIVRRRRHKIIYMLSVSLLAVLIDLDHFLVPLGIETIYRSMHNVFAVILLPLIFFLASYHYEKDSTRYSTLFLVLTVMLCGHLLADMINGDGVELLYPISNHAYSLPQVDIRTYNNWQVVGPFGLALGIYALIILAGILANDALYRIKKKKMTPFGAFKESVKDYF